MRTASRLGMASRGEFAAADGIGGAVGFEREGRKRFLQGGAETVLLVVRVLLPAGLHERQGRRPRATTGGSRDRSGGILHAGHLHDALFKHRLGGRFQHDVDPRAAAYRSSAVRNPTKVKRSVSPGAAPIS